LLYSIFLPFIIWLIFTLLSDIHISFRLVNCLLYSLNHFRDAFLPQPELLILNVPCLQFCLKFLIFKPVLLLLCFPAIYQHLCFLQFIHFFSKLALEFVSISFQKPIQLFFCTKSGLLIIDILNCFIDHLSYTLLPYSLHSC